MSKLESAGYLAARDASGEEDYVCMECQVPINTGWDRDTTVWVLFDGNRYPWQQFSQQGILLRGFLTEKAGINFLNPWKTRKPSVYSGYHLQPFSFKELDRCAAGVKCSGIIVHHPNGKGDKSLKDLLTTTVIFKFKERASQTPSLLSFDGECIELDEENVVEVLEISNISQQEEELPCTARKSEEDWTKTHGTRYVEFTSVEDERFYQFRIEKETGRFGLSQAGIEIPILPCLNPKCHTTPDKGDLVHSLTAIVKNELEAEEIKAMFFAAGIHSHYEAVGEIYRITVISCTCQGGERIIRLLERLTQSKRSEISRLLIADAVKGMERPFIVSLGNKKVNGDVLSPETKEHFLPTELAADAKLAQAQKRAAR